MEKSFGDKQPQGPKQNLSGVYLVDIDGVKVERDFVKFHLRPSCNHMKI